MTDNGTIDQICRQLAEFGDFETLNHLIRVNQDIHTICQNYLDKAKKSSVGIVLTLYDSEYILAWRFIFKRIELKQLRQEIDEYNQYIQRHPDLPKDSHFTLYDLTNKDDVDDLSTQIVEEQLGTSELIDIITQEYENQEFQMGYHLLPMTKKLVQMEPIETPASQQKPYDQSTFYYIIHNKPDSSGSYVY